MSAVATAKKEETAKKSGTGKIWAGRVISALGVLMLLFSASMKLSHAPQMVDGFVHKYGFSEGALLPIALLELTCTALYLIPRTSIFGAVMLTGYLGGAVCTHVRVGEGPLGPLLVAVLIWLGAFLRDDRVREIIRAKH